MKVDLNCLDPGNVNLNNLNALVLNVLIFFSSNSILHQLVYKRL